MWAVVIFDEMKEVEAVPISWISKCQKKVSWPPIKSSSMVARMIRNNENSSDLWPVYSSRVLKCYDTYEEALRGSRIAEDTSDLAEDEVELGLGSRVIKRKILDDFEVEGLEERSRKEVKYVPELPPVPETLSRWVGPRFEPPPSASFSPCSSPFPGSGISSSGTNDSYKTLVSAIVELKHTVHDMCKVIQSQGEILKSILDKLNQVQTTPPEEETYMMQFPLSELSEFMLHEDKLHEIAYQKYLISLLSSFGGTNAKSIVKKSVDYLMTNGLQRQFNWLGKTYWRFTNQEERKKSFKDTLLCSVITTSIKQTKGLSNVTEEEIHTAIKVYFRNAKDRQGGRSARSATSTLRDPEAYL